MTSNSKIHCLLVHQAFASPQDPGGTRHFELAQRLCAKGHKFTIVAGTVSYLTGEKSAEATNAESASETDGPIVIRAWVPAIHHESFSLRVLAFGVFSWTSFFSAIRTRNIDLVLGTSPPILQAATAWLVAAVRRVPYVLEVRDLWPEFAIDMGVLKNRGLIAVARGLERFLYSRADHIIVNSPAYADYLEDEGLRSSKITLVPNGVDPSIFDPSSRGESLRGELGLEKESFVVTYAGALGAANDIGTILEAAEVLLNRADIKILLVGDGKERRNLERQADEMGVKNVVFLGARPKAEMPAFLAASDACLATLMDIPMFRTTYPNKVFDYMAAGRPTILGIDGVIREVIERSNGGIAVNPGQPEELARAVTFLADNREEAERMGGSARAYVEEHFQRDQQAELFEATLEKVLEQSR